MKILFNSSEVVMFSIIVKWLSTNRHSIRQWLEVALVVGIATLVVYFVFFKPPSFVTLPGGEKVKILDNSSYLKKIDEKLKVIDGLTKKINELESAIRQKGTEASEHNIPEALHETDVKKSVQRMKDNW